MFITIGSKLYIENPTLSIIAYCENQLTLTNPDYITATRLGKNTRWMKKTLDLYEVKCGDYLLPFGCLKDIYSMYPQNSAYKNTIKPLQAIKCSGSVNLYPYQQNALNDLIRAKNGVLVAPCGSGKTEIAVALIKALSGKTLWLTHTSDLLTQSKKRVEQYLKCNVGTITDGKVNIGDITFATIQTMAKLDLMQYYDMFSVIIVDECFVAGTKISTNKGYKNIENIKSGDYVLSYNHKTHKTEWKKVKSLFVKTTNKWYKMTTSSGRTLIGTGNHPIYTKSGYTQLKEIQNGNYVLCDMWQNSRKKKYSNNNLVQGSEKRENILFEGMCKKGEKKTYIYRATKTRIFSKNESIKSNGSVYQKQRTNENQRIKPDEFSKMYKKNDYDKTKKWNSAYFCGSKGRKWKNINISAKSIYGDKNLVSRSDNRISRSNKKNKRAKTFLSNLLQNRYSNSKQKTSNRDRWRKPLWQNSTRKGPKENRLLDWERVESVEIYEQTSGERYKNDNKVYNLEVEHNNNYFANDILVHNCQKVSGSPTRVKQFYKVLSHLCARYKYGLTATPNRADNLIESMFALLGGIVHTISESETNRIKAQYEPLFIKAPLEKECVGQDIITGQNIYKLPYIDTDGTIIYSKLMDTISNNEWRNNYIKDLATTCIKNDKHILILCNLVSQAKTLQSAIVGSELLIGSVSRRKREETLQRAKQGTTKCVVATYSLAKEGLDIPILDTLILASPQKDFTTIKQSVGRIERQYAGKQSSVVYDIVDSNIPYCLGSYKKRKGIITK